MLHFCAYKFIKNNYSFRAMKKKTNSSQIAPFYGNPLLRGKCNVLEK